MQKCIVKGCQNHRDQGVFVGDLCKPCYTMLSQGKYIPSTAWFAVEGRRARVLDVKAVLGDYLVAWQLLPAVSGFAKPAFDVWLAEQLKQAVPQASKSLAQLYDLWDAFADVPVTDSTAEVGADTLEAQFLHFSAGTHREDVWRWFEAQNPQFLVGEVMQGIRWNPVVAQPGA